MKVIGKTRFTGLGLGLLAALVCAGLSATTALATAPVAVSPLNGTPDASASTQISFLGVPASEISDVSVVGSSSGRHTGRLARYATSPGASFLPSHPFTQGEHVTATATVGPRGHGQKLSTTFTIARPVSFSEPPGPPLKLGNGHGLVEHFHSNHGLVPPLVTVTTNAEAAAGADIFMTPTHGYGQGGPMILNPQGHLVWFQPLASGQTATDLQAQTYKGQPVLVWWQGRVSGSLGIGFGNVEIYSNSYRRIATIPGGNGYQADLHEAQLLPSGAAFITTYSLVSADLSSEGGMREGSIQDAILQEIDVPTGLVMFEWHAYGHVSLGDSYSTPTKFIPHPFDYFHLNSISLDPSGDGNFLISARNTWAAYEINHITGAVEWRLGGKHSTFKMGPGTGTAWQHDVRWQPDGTVTIFDNGASPKAHSESRAIRERLNPSTHEVTLVGRYTANILAGSQGDDQVQANGDSFVGWGEAPFMTEFAPTGQVLFSARFPAPGQSYRALRFQWSAAPNTRPSVAAVAQSASAATVYASWNGATSVASWQVLGGPKSSSLTPIQSAPPSGFETAISVPGSYAYFAVRALNSNGAVLGTSATVPR